MQIIIRAIKFFRKHRDGKFFNFKRSLIALSILSFIVYFLSFFGYFQADEWYFFSKYFITLSEPLGAFRLMLASFLDPLTYGAHFTPLLPFIGFVNFLLFGTNFIFYQLQSVLLHVAVTLCIFYLAYLITKKNLFFGLLAGLFFGIAVVHYQAVSWIAAVGVQIAMLFASLSLIFLTKYYLEKKGENRFKKNLSVLFFILAVFSKESSLFLFFTYPLIVYLFNRNEIDSQKNILKQIKYIAKEIKCIIIFGIFYALVLFGFQYLIKVINQSTASANTIAYGSFFSTLTDPALLYKIISWSLKSIVESFIPAKYLYSIGELITVWGFPYYAQEASVHGINYLTFAQSAGMEMFIYPAAIIILLLIQKVNSFFSRKNVDVQNALIIGFVIIIASVIPFIFIANSIINLFGSATVLDSRHLYTTSLGGALIFAAFFFYLFQQKSVFWKYLGVVILTVYIIANLFLLEGILIENALVGRQRKTIVNEILNKASNLGKKTVILVESNSGYYGFGLMPPFQTNLGQTLMLLYYQKGQLPVAYLKNNFLTKGGIAGQGYLKIGDRGFGYFIEEKNLLWEVGQNKLSPSDVYAFRWDGVKNKITDITKQEREKAKNYLGLLSYFRGWKAYADHDNGFSLEYPTGMNVKNIEINNTNQKHEVVKDILMATDNMENCVAVQAYDCEGLYLRFSLIKKPELMGTDNFAALLPNSDGEIMGQNYTFRVIKLLTGNEVTTTYASKGQYPVYFIPYKTGDKIFVVRAYGSRAARILAPVTFQEKWNMEIERIISTLMYEAQ